MASTNKTTHYDLSQYVGSDKPTYLTDYNNDMSAIDTGIYNAQDKADSAYTLANTADGKADTAITNAGLAQGDASSALGKIGTMADLNTTEKTTLVGAVNEVDGIATTAKSNVEKFNITQFTTPTAPTLSTHTITRFSMNCAANSEGSIGKVYGDVRVNISGATAENLTFSTPFRPASQITINGGIVGIVGGKLVVRDYTVDTNGDLTFSVNGDNSTESRYVFINSLVFFTDFGDEPSPQA